MLVIDGMDASKGVPGRMLRYRTSVNGLDARTTSLIGDRAYCPGVPKHDLADDETERGRETVAT